MISKKNLWTFTLAAVTYFMLFSLIYEWLKPLPDLQYIKEMKWFLIFISLTMLIYLLTNNKRIRGLFSFSLLLVLLYLLSRQGNTSLITWVKSFASESYQNLLLIWQRNLIDLTDNFNSLLFLLLLWLTVSAIIHFHKRYKNLWFAILTIAYLATMDSFLIYDAKWAIVRTVIISLFLIAIDKQRDLNIEDPSRVFSLKLVTMAIILVPLIVGIGYISPKADAKWVDPFSFFSQYQGKGLAGGEKIRKIGYGDDDSYLGGPFLQDETIVMETTSTRRVYWRGESKAAYTGHGWVDSEFTVRENFVNISGRWAYPFPYRLFEFNSEIKYTLTEQVLSFPNKTYRNLFLSGDLITVSSDKLPENAVAKAKYYSEAIFTDYSLDNYQAQIVIPIVDTTLLKKAELTLADREISNFLQPYLTLPDSLPERVSELAKEITKDADNPYDQANEIKYYLLQNYEYNIEDVPIPKENEDFVDQFLFESFLGYCDHFSSAMVVLARSIGLPARWVKGFTYGELTYLGENEGYKGIVRNKDAHSWVEIYFEGFGWIPFEPTPGFNLSMMYKSAANLENNSQAEQDSANLERDLLTEEDIPVLAEQVLVEKDSKLFLLIGEVVVVVLILMGMIILIFRNLLSFWLTKKRYAKEVSLSRMIVSATEKMLNILQKKKLYKEPSQTIREYFTVTFKDRPFEDWQEAADIFEAARYSNNDLPVTWREKLWSVWKNILNQIRS